MSRGRDTQEQLRREVEQHHDAHLAQYSEWIDRWFAYGKAQYDGSAARRIADENVRGLKRIMNALDAGADDHPDGTLVHPAPIVAHGDLVGASHAVLRFAEHNAPDVPDAHGVDRIAPVLSASGELAAAMDDAVVLTAPSPTTHGLPPDVRDGRDMGEKEREINIGRNIEAVGIGLDSRYQPRRLTILIDDADPRIVQGFFDQLDRPGGMPASTIERAMVVNGPDATPTPGGTARREIAIPNDAISQITTGHFRPESRYGYSYPRLPANLTAVNLPGTIPVGHVTVSAGLSGRQRARFLAAYLDGRPTQSDAPTATAPKPRTSHRPDDQYTNPYNTLGGRWGARPDGFGTNPYNTPQRSPRGAPAQ